MVTAWLLKGQLSAFCSNSGPKHQLRGAGELSQEGGLGATAHAPSRSRSPGLSPFLLELWEVPEVLLSRCAQGLGDRKFLASWT